MTPFENLQEQHEALRRRETEAATNLEQITSLMVDAFGEDDLEELCDLLRIDFERLEGNSTPERIRALTEMVERQGGTAELLSTLPRLRPEMNWQSDIGLMNDVQAFILEAVDASDGIASPLERNQLRSMLRYWSGYVHEQTGKYPKIELKAPGVSEINMDRGEEKPIPPAEERYRRGFFITLTNPVLLDTISPGGTFFLYAGLTIPAIWFIWKYVPETKGKTLEQIEKFWKGKN